MICQRCGIDIPVSTAKKRKEENNTNMLCADCTHVDKPFAQTTGQCRAWYGDVDEYMRPIKNDRLYMAGERICGKTDCVRRSHLIPDLAPEGQPPRRIRTPKPQAEVTTLRPRRPRPINMPQGTTKPPMDRPMTVDEMLTAEQFSLGHRNGKTLDYEQLMDALKRERLR